MPVARTRTPFAGSVWRGGLYGLKPAFALRLRRVEDVALRRGITPGAVTRLAMVIAFATAGVLIVGTRYRLAWGAVAPLCLLRMGCNAVDGSIARRTRTASPRGAVLNELGDRVADVVTFAALAPAVGVALALGTVITALATSFVAVTGQAVLGERLATGPMGKPDRVAVLSVAAAVAAVIGPASLVAGAWMIVGLGTVTTLRRTAELWHRAGEST